MHSNYKGIFLRKEKGRKKGISEGRKKVVREGAYALIALKLGWVRKEKGKGRLSPM